MEIVIAVIWLTAFSIYFLPSIIAGTRKHANQWPIFWTNLLLGWTVVAWIAALIWSFTAPGQPLRAQPQS